jgi:hypothetical protein
MHGSIRVPSSLCRRYRLWRACGSLDVAQLLTTACQALELSHRHSSDSVLRPALHRTKFCCDVLESDLLNVLVIRFVLEAQSRFFGIRNKTSLSERLRRNMLFERVRTYIVFGRRWLAVFASPELWRLTEPAL